MEIEARVEIRWRYGDPLKARAVAESVQVDNVSIPPGLKKSLNVETLCEDGSVRTKVKYRGEVDTLIKALDDLVFSVKIAEEITEKV